MGELHPDTAVRGVQVISPTFPDVLTAESYTSRAVHQACRAEPEADGICFPQPRGPALMSPTVVASPPPCSRPSKPLDKLAGKTVLGEDQGHTKSTRCDTGIYTIPSSNGFDHLLFSSAY